MCMQSQSQRDPAMSQGWPAVTSWQREAAAPWEPSKGTWSRYLALRHLNSRTWNLNFYLLREHICGYLSEKVTAKGKVPCKPQHPHWMWKDEEFFGYKEEPSKQTGSSNNHIPRAP